VVGRGVEVRTEGRGAVAGQAPPRDSRCAGGQVSKSDLARSKLTINGVAGADAYATVTTRKGDRSTLVELARRYDVSRSTISRLSLRGFL
jgi:hypothetical protein